MRLLPLALISFALAGCAGNVADYVGPRSTIISPQLIRYGLDVDQSRCVGQRLANSLTPLQLRRFQRVAAVVRYGWSEPGRLTPSDLRHVAASIADQQVRTELDRATEACGILVESGVETEAAPDPPAQPSGARLPAWLNLGAAPTGQSIAIDAAILEQDGAIRTAWFRLTDPGQTLPTGMAYQLRIDCQARTISQLDNRQEEAGISGITPEEPGGAEPPLPVEGGTVMEIAWLALCT